MCYSSDDFLTGEELEQRLNKLGIDNFDDTPDASGTYHQSARAMLFPSGFTGEAANMIKADSECEECHATEDLTLDHIKPVSQWFNQTGYKKDRETRSQWYNDTSNLRILCRSCNSAKGGEGFEPKKVAYCYQHGLM